METYRLPSLVGNLKKAFQSHCPARGWKQIRGLQIPTLAKCFPITLPRKGMETYIGNTTNQNFHPFFPITLPRKGMETLLFDTLPYLNRLSNHIAPQGDGNFWWTCFISMLTLLSNHIAPQGDGNNPGSRRKPHCRRRCFPITLPRKGMETLLPKVWHEVF